MSLPHHDVSAVGSGGGGVGTGLHRGLQVMVVEGYDHGLPLRGNMVVADYVSD